MTNTQAIKTFFEKEGGRRVTFQEINALSREEREELGSLAAAELGVEIRKVA